MQVKRETTYRCEIEMAGDVGVIRQACREYCYRVGLCVKVWGSDYIYTGGEEAGVTVSLRNYPRFPKAPEEIMIIARDLAEFLMHAAWQHTCLITADDVTEWLSRREDNPAAR